ncbi:TolC family protein [Sulfurospirillum cavolei]|uniref:TolC family protein n=1 Tax=Sulfurospirillum cavolei TaxID=366522 RepID=UPI003FA20C66
MKIIVIMCALLAYAFGASALSLDAAIEKVKQNNLEIDAAKMDEQIKELEYQIASSTGYGSLDHNQYALRSNDALNVFGYKLTSREASFADFGFIQYDSTNPNVTSIIPDDLNYPQARNLFSTNVTYTIPLYTGGKIEQYRKMAQALKALSTLSREEHTVQKIAEVKKSFYALSLLKNHLYRLGLIAHNIEKLEQRAVAMHEEGYAKKVDILEVQTKRADVERLVEQAKVNETLLYHYLSFLLNENVESIIGNYEAELHLDIPLETMLNENRAIKKAEQSEAVSKMNVSLQESNFLPQIGAFVQYGSSDDRLMNDFSSHDAYTVGLQMKWNLFNGGADKAGLEKARVGNLKAASEARLAKETIVWHIRRLQTQMHMYEYEIASLKKEVELSQTVYENYTGRYEQKLASMSEVIVKQSDALRAVMKLQEAQNARNDVIFELEKIAAKELQ